MIHTLDLWCSGRRLRGAWAHGALVVLLGGCPGEPGTTEATTGSTGPGSATDPTTSTSSSGDAPTQASGLTDTTADPSTGTTGPEPTGSTGDTGDTSATDTTETGETGVIPVPEVCEDLPPLVACDMPITKCKADQDTDQKEFTCDNAPNHFNPDQQDLDGDGFGDIIDRCPTIFTDHNNADTDKDGVGNACDLCPRQLSFYNGAVPVPFYMRVRNIPQQHDADADGIGDVCDNCVRTPNCLDYGDGPGDTPYAVGMPIDVESLDCQGDIIDDNIGDGCVGTELPGAAGEVGFGDDDDFDQDGLVNLGDACPRQPVAPRKCDGDEDCPDGARCAPAGVCNHPDHDNDGVGDICDTCPEVANPEQVTEAGAKLDDPDGDFIGAACEQNAECFERSNPRRHGFYTVSAGGYCCTTIYDGPILDPDGKPLPVEAHGPQPAGVFDLPAGCEAALAASADGQAHPVEWCNVDAPGELYQYFCLLPAWDQEFDGVPDECDLCVHAFDPNQEPYVDANDKVWPTYGKFCQGVYDESQLDPAMMCAQGT